MIIYFDTEFTDLSDARGPIRLISGGFVSETGSELYFELNDNYTKKDCSHFVLENVIPHLNSAKFGMTSAQAALKLKSWCEAINEPIKMASDAPAYDFDLVLLLLREQNITIVNVDTKCMHLDSYLLEDKIQRFFEYQPMAIRHHALWDARALASTFGKSYD